MNYQYWKYHARHPLWKSEWETCIRRMTSVARRSSPVVDDVAVVDVTVSPIHRPGIHFFLAFFLQSKKRCERYFSTDRLNYKSHAFVWRLARKRDRTATQWEGRRTRIIFAQDCVSCSCQSALFASPYFRAKPIWNNWFRYANSSMESSSMHYLRCLANANTRLWYIWCSTFSRGLGNNGKNGVRMGRTFSMMNFSIGLQNPSLRWNRTESW